MSISAPINRITVLTTTPATIVARPRKGRIRLTVRNPDTANRVERVRTADTTRGQGIPASSERTWMKKDGDNTEGAFYFVAFTADVVVETEEEIEK